MKRRNSHWGLFLLLNVLVSAATTLAVLLIWEQVQPARLPEGAQAILAAEQATRQAAKASADGRVSAWQPVETPTQAQTPGESGGLEAVIEISGVVGAGDLNQEYVTLRRLGDSDLNLAGWKLQNPRGESYAFPDLVLYKGGAVQVYSRPGSDSATFLFWNRSAPAWQAGDVITLLDAAGNTRATYTIP